MDIQAKLTGFAMMGATWVMWLLVALSVGGLAIALERAVYLLRTRDNIRRLKAEVLGRALGCAPAEVKFRYGAHGKPGLAGSDLRFNISHSGALAVIALARVEVGVDVELPRPRRSDAIARRFYTPGEIERLFAHADPERRADAFFRLWTCKEAFLKATGEGLSRSTRSYEIAFSPPRLLWATGIPDASLRYSVHPVDVGDPYRAAVVVEAPEVTARTYRWS